MDSNLLTFFLIGFVFGTIFGFLFCATLVVIRVNQSHDITLIDGKVEFKKRG